jgi:predicted DNA-binding WGR domain protein
MQTKGRFYVYIAETHSPVVRKSLGSPRRICPRQPPGGSAQAASPAVPFGRADLDFSAPALKAHPPSLVGLTGDLLTKRRNCGSREVLAIKVCGSNVHIHFGRIGTSDQFATKSFAVETAAAKYADKVTSEKLAKGYTEVSV